MKKRFNTLTLALLLVALCRALLPQAISNRNEANRLEALALLGGSGDGTFTYSPSGESGTEWPQELDGEGLLAIGKKIPLAYAGIYELELISGISYITAERILAARKEILQLASTLPPEESHQALKLVPGIGDKKSADFGRFLSFTSPLGGETLGSNSR